MSLYSNLASYLQLGYPKEQATETTIGNAYLYRGPTSTINTNKPTIGSTWADARPVISVVASELGGSVAAITELMVTTGAVTAISSDLGTPAIEKTIYGLSWRPISRPLDMHPKFRTGGTFALDATAREHVMGWKAEQDPNLRANFKYRKLDSFGVPGAVVTISPTTPAAMKSAYQYISMVMDGIEEYVDYCPIWRKRSIYRGSSEPTAGVIGLVGSPTGCPAAITAVYKFVKSADNVESVGTTTRWRRDEEWEGAPLVFCDRTKIYPSGDGSTEPA